MKTHSIADDIEGLGCALSAAQLGKLLGLSPKTIFKMVKAKRIPALHFGVSVRFDCHAIAEWLRKH